LVLQAVEKQPGLSKKQRLDVTLFSAGMFEMTEAYERGEKFYMHKCDPKSELSSGLKVQMT
jgi:hypothetical protein